MITFLVVIVILLFTYRSPVLWLLPIISAGVAYTISGGVVYLLAKYADLTVNGQSQAILGILVIAAGTDYALLLVARYREELRRHDGPARGDGLRAAPGGPGDRRQRCHRLSSACSAWSSPTSTRPPGMGPVLAVGIAVTLLIMVTLLPALLVICRSLDLLAEAARRSAPPSPPGPACGRRSATRSARARAPCGSVTTGLLLLACLGLFRLDTSGLLDRGHLHEGVRLHQGSEAARGPRPGRQLQHRAGRGQRRRDRRRVASRRRCRRTRRPGQSRRRWATAGPTSRRRSARTSPRPRPSTSSRRPATRPTTSRAPMRSSAAARPSTWTPRPQPTGTTR